MSVSSRSLLLVGSYTLSQPHVKNAKGNGVCAFKVEERQSSNESTPELVVTALSLEHTIDAGPNPVFLAATHDGDFLFSVNEDSYDDGTITVLKRTDAPNKPSSLYHKVAAFATNGRGPCYLTLDKAENMLLCANYYDSSATVFKMTKQMLPKGLTEPSNVSLHLEVENRFSLEGASHAIPSRQEKSHPHSFVVDPQSRFAYIADLGTDQLVQYEFDPKHGPVPESVRFYSLPPGSGPRHIAFHPIGRFLYLVAELSNELFVFEVRRVDGSLKLLQSISTLQKEKHSELTYLAADIQITASGGFIYVSNRCDVFHQNENLSRQIADTIAMFSTAPNGMVSLIGHQSSFGKCPRNILIDPRSQFLVVANKDTDNIVLFKILPDGSLRLEGPPLSCKTPAGLIWLPFPPPQYESELLLSSLAINQHNENIKDILEATGNTLTDEDRLKTNGHHHLFAEISYADADRLLGADASGENIDAEAKDVQLREAAKATSDDDEVLIM